MGGMLQVIDCLFKSTFRQPCVMWSPLWAFVLYFIPLIYLTFGCFACAALLTSLTSAEELQSMGTQSDCLNVTQSKLVKLCVASMAKADQ